MADRLTGEAKEIHPARALAARWAGHLASDRRRSVHTVRAYVATAHRFIDFLGVVGMYDHDRSEPSAAEPSEQFVVDSLWNHDGEAGVNPQPLEMWNIRQTLRKLRQMFVHQGQRVAAGKDHFVQAFVAPKDVESRLPFLH